MSCLDCFVSSSCISLVIYIYILFVLNAFCSQPQNDGLSLIVTAKMFLGVF